MKSNSFSTTSASNSSHSIFVCRAQRTILDEVAEASVTSHPARLNTFKIAIASSSYNPTKNQKTSATKHHCPRFGSNSSSPTISATTKPYSLHSILQAGSKQWVPSPWNVKTSTTTTLTTSTVEKKKVSMPDFTSVTALPKPKHIGFQAKIHS